LLLQEWIPAVPEVKTKPEKGALVADVGCGRGRAIIKLAQAFPNSRFVGYDIFEPVIQYANLNPYLQVYLMIEFHLSSWIYQKDFQKSVTI
jgi:ubiquinone/menaquinone biosynthesis C-methylase UbiE